MEFPQLIPASIRLWRRPKRRPDALQLSPLSKLPVEIIIQIAEHLPLVAATSFSLSCTPIYTIIAPSRLRNPSDSSEMLQVLERNMHDHVACYYCKKFHVIREAKRHIYSLEHYRIWRLNLPVYPCWSAMLPARCYIHHDFSTVVFQMVMKRHRQGADCTSLLQLLSQPSGTFATEDHVRKSTALFRITNGVLLFRKHTVVIVPPSQLPFPRRGFFVCPHLHHARKESQDPIGHIVRSRARAWNQYLPLKSHGSITRCEYCATEFQIDFKDFGVQGVAVLFTRWQDLGAGRSPDDEVWRRHLENNWERETEKVPSPIGSICAEFEVTDRQYDAAALVTAKEWEMLFKKAKWRRST